MPALTSITTVLTALGISPTALGPAIMEKILSSSGGDKKRRLESIELSALTMADQANTILEAIQGKTDESSVAVREKLIQNLIRSLLMLATTADYDGSIGGG